MGYEPIKIVEGSHFQNNWHSWALIHECFFFPPNVITTIYLINCEVFLNGLFD
jgi:hypothetical protein